MSARDLRDLLVLLPRPVSERLRMISPGRCERIRGEVGSTFQQVSDMVAEMETCWSGRW